MGDATTKPPAHTVRFGAVQAAVWTTPGTHGTMYSVTVSRSYRDGEEWKSTGSFAPEDLLPLGLALQQAYTWIQLDKAAERAGQPLL